MRIILVLSIAGGIAAVTCAVWFPKLALPVLGGAMVMGSVSGFYFSIRVGEGQAKPPANDVSAK